MHNQRGAHIYTYFSPSLVTCYSYTVVPGYRSLGKPAFMVSVATNCCFSANGISVSMVTGRTRASLEKSVVPALPVFCIGMISLPPPSPPLTVTLIFRVQGAACAVEQVLLGLMWVKSILMLALDALQENGEEWLMRVMRRSPKYEHALFCIVSGRWRQTLVLWLTVSQPAGAFGPMLRLNTGSINNKTDKGEDPSDSPDFKNRVRQQEEK